MRRNDPAFHSGAAMSVLETHTDRIPVVRRVLGGMRGALARSEESYSPALCLALLLAVGIVVKLTH